MREMLDWENRPSMNTMSNEYGESRAALDRMKYLGAFLTGVKQATDKKEKRCAGGMRPCALRSAKCRTGPNWKIMIPRRATRSCFYRLLRGRLDTSGVGLGGESRCRRFRR